MSKEEKVAWDYLKGNLDNQVTAYSRLVDILRLENKALIERKHQELIDASALKEILTPEITELQNQMISIMSMIVSSGNSNPVTLSQVIDFSPASYKEYFVKIKRSLNEFKKEIMMLRYRNQKLMENALRYIQHMMNRVMDICSDNQQVYCQRGNANVLGKSRNWMDIVA